ncbi:putative inactive serine/threonine-protein kinase slob1 [Diplonema papillatum]|nr:putative inactive serine/threonine-protein kinase slob1 [Diplonema papillatum]|eukprot:gene3606-5598_t
MGTAPTRESDFDGSDEVCLDKRPEWVSDEEAITCSGCRQRFTLLRRRHHCRICGIVVCSRCSAIKADGSPELGYSGCVRQCLRCRDQAREQLAYCFSCLILPSAAPFAVRPEQTPAQQARAGSSAEEEGCAGELPEIKGISAAPTRPSKPPAEAASSVPWNRPVDEFRSDDELRDYLGSDPVLSGAKGDSQRPEPPTSQAAHSPPVSVTDGSLFTDISLEGTASAAHRESSALIPLCCSCTDLDAPPEQSKLYLARPPSEHIELPIVGPVFAFARLTSLALCQRNRTLTPASALPGPLSSFAFTDSPLFARPGLVVGEGKDGYVIGQLPDGDARPPVQTHPHPNISQLVTLSELDADLLVGEDASPVSLGFTRTSLFNVA